LTVYPDTSFLVSLYLPDAHSRSALRRLKEGVQLWLTPLHRVECSHAISQHVFRKIMSEPEAHRILALVEEDRKTQPWVEVPVPEKAFETCARLARDWVPRLGTRTLDTLHVACALELAATVFWTFDERQAKLAAALGLRHEAFPGQK
jgi:predicted nucleic acid-binding protein